MTKTRFIHAVPVDAIILVLTAFSFFGMWFLWPVSKASTRTRDAVFQSTRYIFRASPGSNLRDPTQLVHPLSSAAGLDRNYFDDLEAVTPGRTDQAKLLEQPSSAGTNRQDSDVLWDPVERRIRSYVESPVFVRNPTPPPGTVRVSVSSSLRNRAFDTSILSAVALPQPEQPWILKASVEVDDHGTVDRVFLDLPTSSADLNAAVLRALYGSRARRDELPCEGIVTVLGTGRGAAAKVP